MKAFNEFINEAKAKCNEVDETESTRMDKKEATSDLIDKDKVAVMLYAWLIKNKSTTKVKMSDVNAIYGSLEDLFDDKGINLKALIGVLQEIKTNFSTLVNSEIDPIELSNEEETTFIVDNKKVKKIKAWFDKYTSKDGKKFDVVTDFRDRILVDKTAE